MTSEEARRRALLGEIEVETRETARWTGRSSLTPRVLAAMAGTPREAFVDPGTAEHAYENRPLSIGHKQTISQPFIVAIMTELLDVGPEDRVLEVGTGSGYQAAVLARLAQHVYSVEVIPELAESAGKKLRTLGLTNVSVDCHDGSKGWPEHAPFDRIIVTAAGADIPRALTEQLRRGGRMVIPVGASPMAQALHVVTKDDAGDVEVAEGLPVAFVPLVSR